MTTKRMRPFFPYFGSKYRAAKHYPEPEGVVVEPFAGSACYSTWHGVEESVLVDLDHKITSVWEYLISASEQDIFDLPDLSREGDSTESLPEGAANLIGFWLTKGSQPVKRRGAYAASEKWRHLFWRPEIKERIASQLHRIRGWRVIHGDYAESPSLGGTYFVDPPYLVAGKGYKFSDIDYSRLGSWCRELGGRVIVCEGEDADWLPFKNLGEFKTMTTGKKIEKIWTNGVTGASELLD